MCNDSYPIVEPGFILAVKVTAGVTSILSILGASLIIFTYVAFPKLRTTARQLLVCISVADIIVAASHFVGLMANFERFICQFNPETWNNSRSDPLCIAQAAFSIFGTLASFLLSLAIGVYLVGLLIWKKPHVWRKIIPVIYIICWGIPAIMIIPNIVKKSFGFTIEGWCYIDKDFYVAEILSYGIWVYLVFLVLPVLYITSFVYIRCKTKNKYSALTTRLSQGKDVKLLFVPILFLLLRIWSTILSIIVFYASDLKQHFKISTAAAAVVILAGIGDNGQGLVNAILFCVFTKQVREQLLSRQFLKRSHSKLQPQSVVDENREFTDDRKLYYEDTTMSYGTSIQTTASIHIQS